MSDKSDLEKRLVERAAALARRTSVTEHAVDDVAQRILIERAMALAQPESDQSERDIEMMEIVEFLLGEYAYAFRTGHVARVIPVRDVTRLPCVPPFIAGVIQMRGKIVAVVDTAKYLGLSQRAIPVFNKALVIERHGFHAAFLADEVLGHRRVASAGLKNLAGGNSSVGRYAVGVVDGTIVLDVDQLLLDPALLVNHED